MEHRNTIAVETLLKGPELRLPAGYFSDDKQGIRRSDIRIKWWKAATTGLTYRDLVLPACETVPAIKIPSGNSPDLPGYDEKHVPVFVGHYWLPPAVPTLAAPNVAILDYSVAKHSPLVAYRWDGETALDDSKFVVTTPALN